MSSRNLETPQQEMQRLIRVIAGKRLADENDDQLRSRAARRLGITESRAKVFWYGETDNIRSHEMDRARDLAAVQPIEEAIDAVEAAERWIEDLALVGCVGLADRVLAGLQGRLAARLSGARASDFRAGGNGAVRWGRRAEDRVNGRPAGPSRRSTPLNTHPAGEGLSSSLTIAAE